MDHLDRRLIDLLLVDGRASYAELGRRLGLSAPAIAERVAKLEDAGIITGYGARIDRRALGYGAECLVSLRMHSACNGPLLKKLEALPQLIACHRVTGEDCLMLRAAVRDMSELEVLIDKLATFGMSRTVLVLSTPFERPLPLDTA
ncbi:Lrp/AsnC family transcriptional regulator [Pseudomonas oryzihabitans]|uniref:Lrp/AsnC family transcriptional regulator n=1 Tax=Pseudomonas oryzihabitans TaxID=47885 RepID=UPI0011249CB3|nr:Lrp/AsnC family transcriptional regulator [Pseudomonas psychrotolerans]QDD88905.1 AsnC family transcriptional regulator [Pseudomonas psychrotolerans]